MKKINIEDNCSTVKFFALDARQNNKFQKKIYRLHNKIKRKIIRSSLKGETSLKIIRPIFSSVSIFELVATRLRGEGFNVKEVTTVFSNGMIINWL